ncbi:MAG: lipid-A-disaccharide synthase [Candidatus Marinamargulisbacteria bacterium]
MHQIFISVGETSGDMYAAAIIKQLPAISSVYGNGGEQMEAAGCQLLYNVVNHSTIGFIEPLVKIPYFLNVFRKTKQFILKNNIRTVVIIDHQGFNIPLAKWCKSKNIRVISFIAPQFWLWGQRKKAVAFCSYCDTIACIFEKEYTYYQGIAPDKAQFVGHPLISLLPKRNPSENVVIGLFPGSRSQEIKYCLPMMLDAAKQLHAQFPKLTFKMAVASKKIEAELDIRYSGVPVEFVYDSRALIAEAHASMVASGTVSLEHALIGTPCVVVYQFSWISFQVARWLVMKKIEENCSGFMALPNILAKKEICPEFLQSEASVQNIVTAMTGLLTDQNKVNKMIDEFESVRSQLDTDDNCFKLLVSTISTQQY